MKNKYSRFAAKPLALLLVLSLLISSVGLFSALAAGPNLAYNCDDYTGNPYEVNNPNFFNPKLISNGGLWTDKSVSPNGSAGFNIELSALGQSFSMAPFSPALDVVLVMDVAQDMAYGGEYKTRASVMLDEANKLAREIMTANPQSRIAAVFYGGHEVYAHDGVFWVGDGLDFETTCYGFNFQKFAACNKFDPEDPDSFELFFYDPLNGNNWFPNQVVSYKTIKFPGMFDDEGPGVFGEFDDYRPWENARIEDNPLYGNVHCSQVGIVTAGKMLRDVPLCGGKCECPDHELYTNNKPCGHPECAESIYCRFGSMYYPDEEKFPGVAIPRKPAMVLFCGGAPQTAWASQNRRPEDMPPGYVNLLSAYTHTPMNINDPFGRTPILFPNYSSFLAHREMGTYIINCLGANSSNQPYIGSLISTWSTAAYWKKALNNQALNDFGEDSDFSPYKHPDGFQMYTVQVQGHMNDSMAAALLNPNIEAFSQIISHYNSSDINGNPIDYDVTGSYKLRQFVLEKYLPQIPFADGIDVLGIELPSLYNTTPCLQTTGAELGLSASAYIQNSDGDITYFLGDEYWSEADNAAFDEFIYYPDAYIDDVNDCSETLIPLLGLDKNEKSTLVAQGGYITQTKVSETAGPSGAYDQDTDGYVMFSDVIGRYMKVDPATLKVVFDNVEYSANNLVANKPNWTAQNPLKYTLQTYEVAGNIVVPDQVFGRQRLDKVPLSNAFIEVITALEDDVRPPCELPGNSDISIDRLLKKDQQEVRWYIPASLLPQRTIDATDDGYRVYNFSTNSYAGANNVTAMSPHPIRARYKVGLTVTAEDQIDPDELEAYRAQLYLVNDDEVQGNVISVDDELKTRFHANAWDWDFEGGTYDNRAAALFKPSEANPFFYCPDYELAEYKAGHGPQYVLYNNTNTDPPGVFVGPYDTMEELYAELSEIYAEDIEDGMSVGEILDFLIEHWEMELAVIPSEADKEAAKGMPVYIWTGNAYARAGVNDVPPNGKYYVPIEVWAIDSGNTSLYKEVNPAAISKYEGGLVVPLVQSQSAQTQGAQLQSLLPPFESGLFVPEKTLWPSLDAPKKDNLSTTNPFIRKLGQAGFQLDNNGYLTLSEEPEEPIDPDDPDPDPKPPCEWVKIPFLPFPIPIPLPLLNIIPLLTKIAIPEKKVAAPPQEIVPPPKTGDDNAAVMWALLLFASAAGLAVCVVAMGKKRKEELA